MDHFTKFILSKDELNKIKNWKYKVTSDKWLSPLISPFYSFLLKYIPKIITPNILSLIGLIFSILAYNFSTYPLLFALFTFLYMTFDDLDGKQARKTNSSSPLGELIDHCFDSITNVLLTVGFLNMFHIFDNSTILSAILINNLLFQNEHLKAYLNPNKTIHFYKYSGPTEILFYSFIICIFQFIFDFDLSFLDFTNFNFLSILFRILFCFIGLNNSDYFIKFKHNNLTNFLINLLNNLMFFYFSSNEFYLIHGFLFNLSTLDLIISKMASSNLHPFYLIINLFGLLFPSLCYLILPIYFYFLIFSISSFLNLPIFSPIIKIFVSGYYDGLHYGHINSLKIASKLGHRLIVGIHSDEDSLTYKNKKPIDNLLTRNSQVSQLPFVYSTIPNCPQIFDQEFIQTHQIDLIGVSDEYLYSNDLIHPSYQYAKDHNMIVIIPRTPGISSTLLREQSKIN